MWAFWPFHVRGVAPARASAAAVPTVSVRCCCARDFRRGVRVGCGVAVRVGPREVCVLLAVGVVALLRNVHVLSRCRRIPAAKTNCIPGRRSAHKRAGDRHVRASRSARRVRAWVQQLSTQAPGGRIWVYFGSSCCVLEVWGCPGHVVLLCITSAHGMGGQRGRLPPRHVPTRAPGGPVGARWHCPRNSCMSDVRTRVHVGPRR